MTQASEIAATLGLRGARREPITSGDELVGLVESGLPFAAVEALAARYALPTDLLAASVGIPARTLARRKKEGKLSRAESDSIARIARILAHAEETFGNPSSVGKWLQTEIRALGYKTPLSRLSTDFGATEVDHILGRIDHGVFS